MAQRRLVQRVVARAVVDDQDLLDRAGLLQHGRDGPVDDVSIIEGVDMGQNAHRTAARR
jgi:hypothetical protein